MSWQPLRPTLGVVRGRQWSAHSQRAVTTHRRGWRAVVIEGNQQSTRRLCGHAHSKPAAARTCGERWARSLNKVATS